MCPLYNFDSVWDNFTKLGPNKSMTILWLWTVTPSTFFSVLCHFIILYMASMEIVSFCRIIPLCNFQYRNHVHSITLISFQIILQNLLQILSMTGRHAQIKDCHFTWCKRSGGASCNACSAFISYLELWFRWIGKPSFYYGCKLTRYKLVHHFLLPAETVCHIWLPPRLSGGCLPSKTTVIEKNGFLLRLSAWLSADSRGQTWLEAISDVLQSLQARKIDRLVYTLWNWKS